MHSFDPQLRNSPQGYGHLSFAQHCIGCSNHSVRTWRPLPSLRQRVNEWFVGGAPGLREVDFAAYPGPQWMMQQAPTPMNKMATKTEPGGTVNVRTMCVIQYPEPCAPLTTLPRTNICDVCHTSSCAAPLHTRLYKCTLDMMYSIHFAPDALVGLEPIALGFISFLPFFDKRRSGDARFWRCSAAF